MHVSESVLKIKVAHAQNIIRTIMKYRETFRVATRQFTPGYKVKKGSKKTHKLRIYQTRFN